MLDLQAQYLPNKETTGLRAVSPASHNRKPSVRENGFVKAMNKASTLQANQNQAVKTDTDQPNPIKDIPNDRMIALPKENNEPQADAIPTQADQEAVTVELEPKNIKQDNRIIDDGQDASQAKCKEPCEDETVTDASTVVWTVDMSQPAPPAAAIQAEINLNIPIQPIVSNNTSSTGPTDGESSSPEAVTQTSIDPIRTQADVTVNVLGQSAEPIVVEPINNPQSSFQAQPEETDSTPVETQPGTISIISKPIVDDSTAAEIVVRENISKTEGDIQNQLPEAAQNSQTDTINIPILLAAAVSAKTPDPSANKQDSFVGINAKQAADVSEQQVASQPVASTEAANESSPPVPETVATMLVPELSSKQGKDDKTSSKDEAGKTVQASKDKPTNIPEEIRLKLLEKLLQDSSQKSNDSQGNTDLKKLLGEEIQRLRAEKPELKASDTVEAPAVKTHSDAAQVINGMEKLFLITEKTGLDANVSVDRSDFPTANVDPQDLVEQIVKKVEYLNKTSNSEMKIQLKPEFLGKMMIKVALEDGVVTARFITESHQVKQLLEANMSSLKQNLESQGLKVDRTEVNVQLDNGGTFHGNDSGRQQMWQEYADRSSYNRLPYQAGEDYGGTMDTVPEPYIENAAVNSISLSGDGKVDFMI